MNSESSSRDRQAPLQEIAQGFRSRTLKSVKLASKLGMGYVRRALGVHADDAEDEDSLQRVRELVGEIGALKGLVMKFGQIASYVPGALPPRAQRVLAELQSQSQPMAYDRVVEVITNEFGSGPEALFDEFETEPFAAASIGQVHRARLRGRSVAVKVQYPGIEQVLHSDLDKAALMAKLASLGTALDGKALAGELAARVIEECDYRGEAYNQIGFARLFERYPGARVPAVHLERCRQRVLTSDLVDGHEFYSFCEQAPAEARNRAGTIIFRACYETIFRHCIYNADPHPGNYLLHDGGDVTFLDFGCVRRFDPEMIDAWKTTARATAAGDRRRFEEGFVRLGMAPDPKRFDWDHQWNVMQYIYQPFTAPGFTFTHDYVRKSYDLLLFNNPNRNRSGMPPAWLFLNRLQWGLNAVLAHLHASGPWPELWRAAVESPTEPARWPLEA